MATWPDKLPQTGFTPVRIDRGQGFLRTDMDSGPPKQRRRTSAVPKRYRVSMRLTGEQVGVFDSFYENTLSEGALSFQWEDPTTGQTKSYRFTDAPGVRLLVGDADPDNRLYELTMNLEILP